MECATSNNPSWCDFCIALETYQNIGMTPEYVKLSDGGAVNRELMVTENFRVMVALGPVAVGNLLIVTENHLTSMAQLNEDWMKELVVIKNKIRKFFLNNNIQIVFFEHGLKNEEDADGCISHAHLQVLPVEQDLLDYVQTQYNGYQLPKYEQLRSINLDGYKGYLHYETIKGANWVFPVNSLESQYIRKLATKVLGTAEQWNWRLFPRLDVIRQTVDMLKDNLQDAKSVGTN